MKTVKTLGISVVLSVTVALFWSVTVQGKNNKKVPGDSIYQLDTQLTDQRGKTTKLDLYRGHPVVVSMFYASCPYACPMLLGKLKSVERDLPKKSRNKLRFLLISFNPKEDTPKVLNEVARRYKADAKRWRFTSAAKENVREIAAVLGIKYKKLEDGEYSHSTIINLVNSQGVVVKHFDSLNKPIKDIVTAVTELTSK